MFSFWRTPGMTCARRRPSAAPLPRQVRRKLLCLATCNGRMVMRRMLAIAALAATALSGCTRSAWEAEAQQVTKDTQPDAATLRFYWRPPTWLDSRALELVRR